MLNQTTITIRKAYPEDASAILETHCAAVHGSGSATAYYELAIINAWSPIPVPLERINDLEARIKAGEEVAFVAENERQQIIGFGSILPKESKLGSLYVHPDYGKQGVGGRLLETLENLAVETGLSEMSLDASLNAEKFYLSHGYIVINRGQYVLRSGMHMSCVKMKKALRSSDGVR